MRIIITGSPGVGKTSAAKALAKRLKCRAVNEKEFALEKGIGKWDEEQNELVIPLGEFAKRLEALFAKERNVVVEGHLLCELKIKADFFVLLRLNPVLLEERLHKRGYSEEKVQDNVFCEANDYCKKHAERNFSASRLIEVQSGKNLNETLDRIIKGLKEKGAFL